MGQNKIKPKGVTKMKSEVLIEATRTAEMNTPFAREAILQVLDEAPDGYKFLARLVEDPCELLQGYEPNSKEEAALDSGDMCHTKPQVDKPEELLKKWLIKKFLKR